MKSWHRQRSAEGNTKRSNPTLSDRPASREAKITASLFREIHKWKLERETALSMQTKESDGKEIRLGLISFGTQRKEFSLSLIHI